MGIRRRSWLCQKDTSLGSWENKNQDRRTRKEDHDIDISLQPGRSTLDLPVPVQVVQERNATSYIVSHFYHLFYNIAVVPVPVSPTLLPVQLTTVQVPYVHIGAYNKLVPQS